MIWGDERVGLCYFRAMALLDQINFAEGQLPPWLAPAISLTRPLATTLTGMVIPVGAAACGTAAIFSPDTALHMAEASTAFLKGLPEPLYYLIGGVFGFYSISKTAEAIKAPPPVGGTSPEQPATAIIAEAPASAPAPTPDDLDVAPSNRRPI